MSNFVGDAAVYYPSAEVLVFSAAPAIPIADTDSVNITLNEVTSILKNVDVLSTDAIDITLSENGVVIQGFFVILDTDNVNIHLAESEVVNIITVENFEDYIRRYLNDV